MTIDKLAMDRRTMLRGTAVFAGVAVTLPAMGALGGCSGSVPPDLARQMPLVSAIAERIIPATDTPGAIAAGVPDYIGAVARDFLTEAQRAELVAGLEAIEDAADRAGLESFESADAAQQDAVLLSIAQGDAESPEGLAFQQIRDLTVFGFFTSEVATQVLAYEEIPGRWVACLPLAEVGAAWLERGGNWQPGEDT